ncbi:sensor histidine kinase [Streptococcus oricebi]|uniref:histidine kinase n=1 Tax=Streptococcus oricebi TaxID=1547447 RepID=A0ABS5B444_9STRE|nr:HAMP domain-containing sensor histidine kinase [Streptococcus oricebi]MBP2623597.1 sensor histidine kinase [Streptococcus oricebi]
MHLILLILFASLGLYWAWRYYSLLFALKQVENQIRGIGKTIQQNNALHLPTPNRHLASLLVAFNHLLSDMQKERVAFYKQERDFKKQIESISHDLRTPLTVILGYLKFIKKKDLSKNELSETLITLEKKAESMRTLVEQFYDFSRLTAQDYQLQLDSLDISRLLKENLLSHYQILEQAQLKIDTHIPAKSLLVLGDALALERIFANLLQNAARYAKSFLNIEVEKRGEEILMHFTNDSDSLSPEDIPHLFDRFYRQDQARQVGSTGLGLTVAQTLAREMGGELQASIQEPEKDRLVLQLSLSLKAL